MVPANQKDAEKKLGNYLENNFMVGHKKLNKPILLAAILLPSLLLHGCTWFGGKALPADRNTYNIALQRSNDEELLLNLVRLKYRDTPLFLKVGSISSQSTFTSSAKASATLPVTGTDIFGLGGDASLSIKPTVNYTPLQGKEFNQQYLSRVKLETILLLIHSGWRIDRIFSVCLQRLGSYGNAVSASSPTPALAPDFEDFARAAKLFHFMQFADVFEISLVQVPKEPINPKNQKYTPLLLVDRKSQGKKGNSKWSKTHEDMLKNLLGLEANEMGFVLGTAKELPQVEHCPKCNKYFQGRKYLRVETRSLAGIMYFLSQSVQIPVKDQSLVTQTKDEKGRPFYWEKILGNTLKVHPAKEEPQSAAVKVNYRDSWFYLNDADQNSKSTFSMLTQIFALQAGEIESHAPVLTLPVGGP